MLINTMKTIINIMAAFDSENKGFDIWWNSLHDWERVAITRKVQKAIEESAEIYSD